MISRTPRAPRRLLVGLYMVGRDEQGFVDLPQTMARFEAAGIDLTGMVAASEDDWDRYKSLQCRAAVETGGDEVMEGQCSSGGRLQ